MVALVIIAISVGASVGTSSKSSERQYTPGDTRLVPVDSSFCSGASVSGTNRLLEATLYALSRRPALTSWNNFTLNESSVSVPFSGYVYYQFYLHKGSAANGRSCLAGSFVSSLQLLIIKGTSNFNSWVNRPRTSRALHTYTISQTCPASSTFDFQSTADDYYFFVYYNTRSTSASVTAWFQFFRTQYTVNPSDVLSSCYYDGARTCSISTTSGATYLLAVKNNQPHSQNGDFSVDCIANGGIIAVIVLIPLLVLALLVAVIIVVACYCRYKHAKKAAASTPPTAASDPMVQPAQPEAPSAATFVNVTTTAPPAYNPSYPAAPPPYSTVTPSYGSTGDKAAGI